MNMAACRRRKERTPMLLIQNAHLIDPASRTDGIRDILTTGEKIIKIAEHIAPEEASGLTILDAKGLTAIPGLVDAHVHFRDPGFTWKEDIESGARAAAAGGVTTVVLMANTKPCVDNVDTLRYVLEKGEKTPIHVETCANVTLGMKGKELVDMKALHAAGAAGFTDDGIPLLEEETARAAMEAAAAEGVPISFHEENPAFIQNNGINAGKASAHFGIGGSDRQAEIDMVERDVRLAEETGACVVIQHISTKEAVELVRQARQKGRRRARGGYAPPFHPDGGSRHSVRDAGEDEPASAGGSRPAGHHRGTCGRHHRYDRHRSCAPQRGGKGETRHGSAQRHHRPGNLSGSGNLRVGGHRKAHPDAAHRPDVAGPCKAVRAGRGISGGGRSGGSGALQSGGRMDARTVLFPLSEFAVCGKDPERENPRDYMPRQGGLSLRLRESGLKPGRSGKRRSRPTQNRMQSYGENT